MAVKFFSENKINSGCTFTFTSATNSLSTYLYDNNIDLKLISTGSTDLIPEVFTIDFNGSKTIDCIHIANHNIKSGTLKYYNGSSYVDFSNVISWSNNTATSNYFTFNSVTTTKIQLTMNTTIVANAQKYVGELRAMAIVGTVERNPADVDIKFDEKVKKLTLDNGSTVLVHFGEKISLKLKFDNATQNDITLFRSLKNSRSPFYVYLSGGEGTYYEEGFRISDMYLVVFGDDFAYELPQGILLGAGVKIKLTLNEAS